MKFTYQVIEQSGGFSAECVETDAVGEGETLAEAVESLRTALEERMFRPDAIAPPSRSNEAPIELEPAAEPRARPSLDLGGPGDVPPR